MESTTRKLLPNPRQTSNIFSVLFFTWTIPIYRKSFRKQLTIDDVHEPLYKDQSNRLGDRLDGYAFTFVSFETEIYNLYHQFIIYLSINVYKL